MSRRKGIDAKILTAQEFINVEDISDGLLYSRDGYLFGYLSVRAGDNRLLSESERGLLAEKLTLAMNIGDEKPFQLLSIPRTVDTMGMIEYMAEKRKDAKTDAKLRLLNGEINSLRDLAREGAKEPMIVVKCWEKASRGADLLLKKRLNALRANLSDAKVLAGLMSDTEITYLCRAFADLTTHQETAGESLEDIPLLPGKKRFLSRKGGGGEEAEALRCLLTPVGGLRFGVSCVAVGTVIGRVYGAMRYPSELDYGWAVSLVNNSNCVTSITYYPENQARMADALSRSIRQSAVDAESESNARRRKHYAKQAMDADRLMEEVDFKSAPVGHVSILAMPFTDDEDRLEDVCREVCARFSAKRIKLRPLGNIQKDAYKHLSPYYANQPAVDDTLKRICPLETVMGGFPMTVNLYRDDHGSYFGRTMDGGVMALDLFYRGHDRTSSNIVFTGMPGMGKSTAIKHLAMTQYMLGAKVIVIDPEREFRDICMSLSGTWLDMGGGTARINPFHIRSVPRDDEEEAEPLYKANDNAMALYIHTLEVFFKLYLPSLTDYDRALLKKELVEVYRAKGITWDTDLSQLRSGDFPTAREVHQRLCEQDDPQLRRLAVLLYDMAEGADSFLWNGHTNVDLSNDLIVLDTNRLMDSSDEVKRAQYFNILSLCWEIMSEDRARPVVLVCDEGHILFDPAIPQTSMYVRNYAKRGRKYESGLWLVTHSLVDILNERVKLCGQTILDCATYKIFFGSDGKNLEETGALFHLTEEEKNVLLAQQRGRALMLLGSQRLHVDFAIPQYKLELMGKGGGR